MRIVRNHKMLSTPHFLILPIVLFAIIAVSFFILIRSSARSLPIGVDLPKAATSDAVASGNMIITVTGDNIFYVDGEVMTLREIERRFSALDAQDKQIIIKADRRASAGRVWDVMDAGRRANLKRISVAADAE